MEDDTIDPATARIVKDLLWGLLKEAVGALGPEVDRHKAAECLRSTADLLVDPDPASRLVLAATLEGRSALGFWHTHALADSELADEETFRRIATSCRLSEGRDALVEAFNSGDEDRFHAELWAASTWRFTETCAALRAPAWYSSS